MYGQTKQSQVRAEEAIGIGPKNKRCFAPYKNTAKGIGRRYSKTKRILKNCIVGTTTLSRINGET